MAVFPKANRRRRLTDDDSSNFLRDPKLLTGSLKPPAKGSRIILVHWIGSLLHQRPYKPHTKLEGCG